MEESQQLSQYLHRRPFSFEDVAYERLKLLLLSVITRQGLGFDMPWTFPQATKAFSFSVVKDRRTVTEPDAD